jgi:predicted MFS family arabinose efflux permease
MMFLRLLAGIAHALFWPSSEVLISSTSESNARVKGIALFTAAWVAGFMLGPLAGKLVLDVYDFRVLFQAAAIVGIVAVVPAFLARRHGVPLASSEELRIKPGSIRQVLGEMTRYPAVSAVLIYYAVTFGVILSVYPAYMGESSLSSQSIEYLFFVFGISRFATLYFVPKISNHGEMALALAVGATAIGMLFAYASDSILSFAASLVLMGAATSIFYPVTLGMVTRNMPRGQMGQRLGAYEAIFGVGWAVGPLAVGLSSDSFGSSSPYLALSVIGGCLAISLALLKKR